MSASASLSDTERHFIGKRPRPAPSSRPRTVSTHFAAAAKGYLQGAEELFPSHAPGGGVAMWDGDSVTSSRPQTVQTQRSRSRAGTAPAGLYGEDSFGMRQILSQPPPMARPSTTQAPNGRGLGLTGRPHSWKIVYLTEYALAHLLTQLRRCGDMKLSARGRRSQVHGTATAVG